MAIVVHKFGGTSVGSGERMRGVVERVLERPDGEQAVVVVSAMSGITDLLVRLADTDADVTSLLEILQVRHRDALAVVAPDADADAVMGTLVNELDAAARALRVLASPAPVLRDRILATGEKLAARMVALAFRGAGVAAKAVDADTFLETDEQHAEANPLPGLTALSIRTTLQPLVDEGVVPVVTGFCGRSPSGRTTTLGRGGSDFTATLVGGGLNATRVLIWTDIDGVYTSDPRAVPEARTVTQLNYREAAELAYFGAKVLHPRTLEPVVSRSIPVQILNTFRPELPGTIVDARVTPGSHPVKGLSAVRNHGLLSLEGRGIAGVPGVAARLFRALADAGVSITMISQSNAESSITLAVPREDVEEADRAIRRAFCFDMAHGTIGDIQVRPSVGLVAAVGLGMANTPGIAGRVFRALARQGVNVLAIAQGSSELNISLAVEDPDVEPALRALHDAFGLDRRDTGVEDGRGLDLVVHGFGSVARMLVRMVAERQEDLRERTGHDVRVVAVSDRGALLVDPRGLSWERIEAASQRKQAGGRLAEEEGSEPFASSEEAFARVWMWRLRRPVFVDLSSDPESGTLLLQALRAGADVVTANKWPLAGEEALFNALVATAQEQGRALRYEATVGAGLPVHDTIEMLRATGDRIHSIVGCLSGTLSWVLYRLQQGDAFSDAVLEAHRRGYTETDPVLDLVGGDVERKVLIAARSAGIPLRPQEITVEPLVDRTLLGLSSSALAERLPAWDAQMARALAEARVRSLRPRMVGRVGAHRGSVRLEFVGPQDPLYDLQETDNRIVIQSERYASRPLTVTGPGAGVEVTAMGVLGDILRVVGARRQRRGV